MSWYDDVYNAVTDTVLETIAPLYGAEYTPPPSHSSTSTPTATANSGVAGANMTCRTAAPRSGGSTYWRSVQQKLCNLGYDPGVIDGLVGSNTRGAIRSLQSTVGFTPTGQVDGATGARLNVAAEATAVATTGGGGGRTTTAPRGGEGEGENDDGNGSTGSGFFSLSNPTMWLTLAGVMLLGGGAVYGVVWYHKEQAAQLPGAMQPERLAAESMPPTLVQDELADLKAQLAEGE